MSKYKWLEKYILDQLDFVNLEIMGVTEEGLDKNLPNYKELRDKFGLTRLQAAAIRHRILEGKSIKGYITDYKTTPYPPKYKGKFCKPTEDLEGKK